MIIYKGDVLSSGTFASSITVPEDFTLFIEPGSTIQFQPRTGDPRLKLGLQVDGTLKAVGTEEAPIVFTSAHPSPTAGDWSGIFVSPTSLGTEFKHTKVEYAATGIKYSGGTSNDAEPIQIENCEISNFVFNGIDLIFARNTNIVNNLIHTGVGYQGGTASGIYVERSFPTISGNVISDVDTGIHIQRSSSEISNNLIIDYNNDGILSSNSEAQIINNVILRRNGAGQGYPVNENTQIPQRVGAQVLLKNNISFYPFSDPTSTAELKSAYNNFFGISSCSKCIDIGGNLDNASPDFTDPEIDPAAKDGFRLNMNSQCIDVGDPNILDIDGTRSDMGIWGGPNIPPPVLQAVQGQNSNALFTLTLADTTQYLRWFHNFVGEYNVYHADSSGGPYHKLNNPPISDNQYYVGDQSDGYFVVRSVKDSVESYNSMEVFLNIVTSVESGEITNVPERFQLDQNYPNPFNPSTQIKYQLPIAAQVKLTIYNMLGRRVRTLIDEEKPAGLYNIQWDGLSDRGLPAASGLYFFRIEAKGIGGQSFVVTKKMLLLK